MSVESSALSESEHAALPSPQSFAKTLESREPVTEDADSTGISGPPSLDQEEIATMPSKPPRLAAASYDCSSARLSLVERTICGDAALRSLDATMARLYRRARSEQRTSVEQQRSWLTVRAGCEASPAITTCLKELYVAHIRDLQ